MRSVCWNKKKTVLVFSLTAVFLAVLWTAYSAGAYAVSALKKRALPIYAVERSDKKIAISFDCAWGTDFTDTILNELDRANVKCTFFTVQFWTEKYPDYVKKIDERGHEIGTHSKSHPKMSTLSKSEIENELSSSKSAIEKITGKTVDLFRPPFGDYDDDVIETANALGLFPVQWNVDSLDWKNLSANEIALRIVNGVKPGSIILCHNNGLHTAEALPTVFSTLQNRGYEFVTVGELIYKSDYSIRSDGTQVKNTLS